MMPEKKRSRSKRSSNKAASSRVPSTKSPSSNPSEAFSQEKKVDLPVFLREFDGLLNKGDFDKPQAMLDSLRGLKKWQRLNLQSVIDYKRGNEALAEDLIRQALREPDVKPSINRNLAGMLINQGRMREALPLASY